MGRRARCAECGATDAYMRKRGGRNVCDECIAGQSSETAVKVPEPATGNINNNSTALEN